MTSSPVAAFTSGGPPRKIVPVPFTIIVSSDIAGTYAPPAVHDPITTAIWGILLGRHPRLVEEDAAEVLAIGKHLRLHRQERATRVDQIHAGQTILDCDLLRSQMLLHRDRVVGAALDRRVVGDDQHLATRHPADAGYHAGRGRFVVVHLERRQRRKLEKRRSLVEQQVDPFADRQLALLAMTLEIPRPAALPRGGHAVAQLIDQQLHPLAVGDEGVVSGVDAGVDGQHLLKSSSLPSAAIGLEAARRAAPHGVHPIYLAAAAIAEDMPVVGPRAAVRLRD